MDGPKPAPDPPALHKLELQVVVRPAAQQQLDRRPPPIGHLRSARRAVVSRPWSRPEVQAAAEAGWDAPSKQPWQTAGCGGRGLAGGAAPTQAQEAGAVTASKTKGGTCGLSLLTLGARSRQYCRDGPRSALSRCHTWAPRMPAAAASDNPCPCCCPASAALLLSACCPSWLAAPVGVPTSAPASCSRPASSSRGRLAQAPP